MSATFLGILAAASGFVLSPSLRSSSVARGGLRIGGRPLMDDSRDHADLNTLQTELYTALEEEDYAAAAHLRDRIELVTGAGGWAERSQKLSPNSIRTVARSTCVRLPARSAGARKLQSVAVSASICQDVRRAPRNRTTSPPNPSCMRSSETHARCQQRSMVAQNHVSLPEAFALDTQASSTEVGVSRCAVERLPRRRRLRPHRARRLPQGGGGRVA